MSSSDRTARIDPFKSLSGIVEDLGAEKRGLLLLAGPASVYNLVSNLLGDQMIHTGRHFLQIPGPTNVADGVLRVMDYPVIDHRSAEFARLGAEVLEGVPKVFQTASPVVMYPASGTGAWEAAIVNTLSSGDRVLMFETGQFATLWRDVAERFGLVVDFVPGDWRHGIDSTVVEGKLAEDARH